MKRKAPKLILSLAIIGLCLMVLSCNDEVDDHYDGPSGGCGGCSVTWITVAVDVYNEDTTELICELRDSYGTEYMSCELATNKTYVLDMYNDNELSPVQMEYMYSDWEISNEEASEYIHIGRCTTLEIENHVCLSLSCDEPLEDVSIEFRYTKLPSYTVMYSTYIFTFVSE